MGHPYDMSDVLPDSITALFAYGTLKRGQCRERYWPAVPQEVLRGTVRGTLWDLGPYPGLTVGEDLVAGEIWLFVRSEMTKILQVLDDVEGYHDQPGDWFVRKSVIATAEGGERLPAWVYYYGRPLPETAKQVLPAANGTVSWP